MGELRLEEVLDHEAIPVLPAFAVQVVQLCGQEDVAIQDVVLLVQKDAATASRLLRMANSPVFGVRRAVSTIPQAISVLGLRTVRCVTIASSLLSGLLGAGGGLDVQQLWRSSLVAALAARRLALRFRGVPPDEAFVAGLLKGIGLHVLHAALGERHARLVREAVAGAGDVAGRERAALGFSYADVSARLMARWGLPAVLVEAVQQHEDAPPPVSADQATHATMLHLAESYRRVLERPDAGRVAELNRRTRQLLGQGPETVVENLEFIDVHLCDVAQVMDLRGVGAGELAAARSEATQRLVALIMNEGLPAPGGEPAERRRQHPGMAVFRVAVDRLSRLEARRGPRLVQEVLTAVHQRLRATLRRDDLVIGWRGDGILVLAPGCAAEAALRLGESLCDAVRSEAVDTVEGPLHVSVSVGACWSADAAASDFAQLTEVAEDSLAIATEHGGNEVRGQPLPETARAAARCEPQAPARKDPAST